jgi:hypothetical protein
MPRLFGQRRGRNRLEVWDFPLWVFPVLLILIINVLATPYVLNAVRTSISLLLYKMFIQSKLIIVHYFFMEQHSARTTQYF